MSSIPKFVEYVEAIFLPSINPYLFSPILAKPGKTLNGFSA